MSALPTGKPTITMPADPFRGSGDQLTVPRILTAVAVVVIVIAVVLVIS